MNKPFLATALITAITFASGSAYAEKISGNRYVGASFGFLMIDPDDGQDADLSTISGRIGGFINDYVAAEARAGTGIAGDTIEGVDVDLTYLFGAYARIGAPINNQFFPYVLVGYSRAEIDWGGKDSETDTSYGAGLDFQVVNMILNVEYANWIDKDGVTLDGISVGFSTNF